MIPSYYDLFVLDASCLFNFTLLLKIITFNRDMEIVNFAMDIAKL